MDNVGLVNFKLQWSLATFAWILFFAFLVVSCLQSDFMWLARAGSLMVLCCAIAEYDLAKKTFPRNAITVKDANGIDRTIQNQPRKGETTASRFLHATLCLGTVIWGFSDLLNRF